MAVQSTLVEKGAQRASVVGSLGQLSLQMASDLRLGMDDLHHGS